MKCPVCNVDLVIADRQGIEIDYCPQCRGVWLDRGELDKIIERSLTTPQGPSAPVAGAYREPPRDYERPAPRREYDDDDDYDRKRKKKRRSFLDDLFDFD